MIRCSVEDVIFLKSPEAIRCGSTASTVSVFPAISVSQGEPEGCSVVADSAGKRSGESGFVVEQQPISVDLRETEQNFSQQIVSRFAASGDDMGDIGSACPQNFRKAA